MAKLLLFVNEEETNIMFDCFLPFVASCLLRFENKITLYICFDYFHKLFHNFSSIKDCERL